MVNRLITYYFSAISKRKCYRQIQQNLVASDAIFSVTFRSDKVFASESYLFKKKPFVLNSLSGQQGFTLLEMAMVVSILAITATVVLPSLSSTDPYRLDNASRELTTAIRFARSESIRTTIPHGIVFNTTNDIAKLYSLVSGAVVYNVYHPVDKKLYFLNLKTDAATAGTDLSSYSIVYSGVFGNQPYLGFNSDGSPKFYFFGTDHMLSATATVTLSYAGHSRIVSVSSRVGRVTTQ